MVRMLNKWIIFLMFFSFGYETFASHIIGGEINYNFVNHNSDNTIAYFTGELKIYRDQEGIDFDRLANIGIFRQLKDGSWLSENVVRDIELKNVEYILAPFYVCENGNLSDIEVEMGTYNFEFQLPVSEYAYKLVYQKCCRNNSINNILNPGASGAVYDVTIYPLAVAHGNQSVRFNDFPPTFICANADLVFDNSAIDADGDKIEYSFCTPFVSGGSEAESPGCCNCQSPDPVVCKPPYSPVTYNPTFSASNPIGGTPALSIDNNTGQISGMPNSTGSYVVAVCVKEFRNGILVSETRRDFEFNVTNCKPRLFASVESDTIIKVEDTNSDKDIHFINACNINNLMVINATEQEQFIDNYKWEIFAADGTLVIKREGSQYRNLNIPYYPTDFMYGSMIVNPNSMCADTAYLQIKIADLIQPQFEHDYDPCEVGPVMFMNMTEELDPGRIEKWEWTIENETYYDFTNVSHTFSKPNIYEVILKAIDIEGCEYSYNKHVGWYPMNLFNEITTEVKDTFLCGQNQFEIYGQTFATNSTVLDTLYYEEDGCDSIYKVLNIFFQEEPIIDFYNYELCPNDSIYLKDKWIKDEGTFIFDEQFYNNTCDSIIENYSVYFLEEAHIVSIDTMLCFGEGIEVQEEYLDKEGTYIFNKEYNLYECDSLIYQVLIDIDEKPKESILDTILCVDEFIVFDNELINSEGTYTNTIKSYIGCDSILNIYHIGYSEEPELITGNTYTIPYDVPFRLNFKLDQEIENIRWFDTATLSCLDCEDPVIRAMENESLLAEVELDGCTYLYEIYIQIDNFIEFYIPNIIDKSNTKNGKLFVQCDALHDLTYDMLVYDRYGNLIFDNKDLRTNSQDNAFQANDLDPGSFVYLIYFNEDIEPKRISGSFTIAN